MGNKEQEQHKRNQAYDLRLRGKTYRYIAAELGVSVGTAHRWVSEYMSEVTLPLVDEVRKQEVDRMMRYLDVLDTRIELGDDKAVSLAIKVSERLCKMLGADMPQQLQVEHTETTQVDLAIQDLINRQKAQNALALDEASRRRESDTRSPDDVIESNGASVERIVMEN